ncbi:MAG: hypothetical protein KAJ07_10860, partial [Planctomycetes bacterium]|nr:hypothetical protein [Planctomycetota bacterium]
PDVKVTAVRGELDNARQAAEVNSMTQRDDQAAADRYTLDETLDADVQLEIGRLIMLTKLIRADYE